MGRLRAKAGSEELVPALVFSLPQAGTGISAWRGELL